MADNMQFLGLAQLKNEGERVPYDEAYPSQVAAGKYPSDDEITMSTGRVIYAHGLTLGIGPDGSVSQGWDGGIDADDLSLDERRELATMVIERWQKWAGL